jgi:hypothetical protein
MRNAASITPSTTTATRGTNALSATPDLAWHAVTPDAALDALRTSVDGLSEHDAARRLKTYGPNPLPEGARRSALARFLLQFTTCSFMSFWWRACSQR